ncbi:uncharacterized protein N7518_010147 [Penicillium psychrosexuale]|uniref:uncharacterized protein n=1 Tax=Penicillium psychrosexuale TaxID=1002107 RepID=UPI0025457273|nr:uncharacterized protein N7518_010147 [Penicillium psychrosexuale]KAJ5781664.1 hypothetical protein N7518_010147 [Penicillium psychrosexuale]
MAQPPQNVSMETASDLLARPLPMLTRENGTTNPSDSRTWISTSLFHEWTSFNDEVLRTIQSIDLSGLVPCNDVTSDTYVVGSELGLTGRFTKHVCDAVSLACKSAGLALQFGDRQAEVISTDVIPDVVLLKSALQDSSPQRKTIIPTELKTFWTVHLDVAQIGTGVFSIGSLRPHLGNTHLNLVNQRDNKAVYGVLSTYAYTVFIKRVEDCQFQMTKPIPQAATQPSVRQCIMAVAILAATGTNYVEYPGFNAEMLQIGTGYQASTRSKSQSLSELRNSTQSSRSSITYEHLQEKRPEGYSFFSSSCVDGVIRCSSLFPYGYILVLTKVKGEPLKKRWATAPAERKEFIYQQVLTAINALRDVGVLWADPGPHDVLYHEDDNKPSVSVIDFESIEPLHPGQTAPCQPEMAAIFGLKAYLLRNS